MKSFKLLTIGNNISPLSSSILSRIFINNYKHAYMRTYTYKRFRIFLYNFNYMNMFTRSKSILFPNPITSGVTVSNPITSGITVSNGHEHENVIETKVEKDEVDITFDGDELIERLDILMNKAESDLERSKYLLGKVEGYHRICTKAVKHLKICRRSFVKVIKYSYQMKIRNADYEIDYASAIGAAASVDFTDDTDVTDVTTTATGTGTGTGTDVTTTAAATKESYD